MSETQNSGATTEAAAPPETENLEAHSGQEKGEQMVPLSALQSERAQRQQKEAEAQMLRDNLALLQANMMAYKAKPDDSDSLAPTDVLTVGDGQKAISELDRKYQLAIEEIRIMQRYPDYQEVVTKHLPEILKTNPGIRNTLEKTQDYELAYCLAKNSDSYRNENKKKQINSEAERIVQNSQKAGSLSSVGSVSPVSHAKRYKDMSDADFLKEVQKNLGYA